jgi:hypothetical protein
MGDPAWGQAPLGEGDGPTGGQAIGVRPCLAIEGQAIEGQALGTPALPQQGDRQLGTREPNRGTGNWSAALPGDRGTGFWDPAPTPGTDSVRRCPQVGRRQAEFPQQGDRQWGTPPGAGRGWARGQPEQGDRQLGVGAYGRRLFERGWDRMIAWNVGPTGPLTPA